ncbi:MAG: V-type ATP synthase subunit A [bacterium]
MGVGRIIKVAGPLVVAEGLEGARMFEIARVSDQKLLGEIIEIREKLCSIQVYEETDGIGPGDPVYLVNEPLSVELGPGLIGSIFDGVQRPLDALQSLYGDYIVRGIESPAIPRDKKWLFEPAVKKGDKVSAGDMVGFVQETKIVKHKIMVPFPLEGVVKEIRKGEFTVEETVCILTTKEGDKKLNLLQRWPVRKPRPVKQKLPPVEPLVTGQRIIDMLFPLCKGGTACVPGPFGSGKTVVQHQLAKWCDADIIIFVGCGERGNEMTDVLIEFPELKDPRTSDSLMNRTVLIANTSNMPVAAREASVFTGITIAEYFRDMGYNVALMADSTSRWAEAMREMSGRLEEMPGEEGYPAYLSSRIAGFYERAGRVKCLGQDDRPATLSLIGAVSPPGGDLSEPVVQATLRVVKVFWGLDDAIASRRHFPAIDWLKSYSLYNDEVDRAAGEKIDKNWKSNRVEAMKILQKESELIEIVRLVGFDALSSEDKLTMEIAKSIREDFLHQNAFMEEDTYTSYPKQFKMLNIILMFGKYAAKAIKSNVPFEKIARLPVREQIARAKYIDEKSLFKFEDLENEIKEQFKDLEENKEGVILEQRV